MSIESSAKWLHLSVATVLVTIFSTTVAPEACAQELSIDISKEAVVITDPIVRIGDIAEVKGGSPTWRKKISELDLDSVGEKAPVQISANQVNVRIQLAGYSRPIAISGRDSVFVMRQSNEKLRTILETKIRDEVCRQFGLRQDQVTVRLQESQVTALAGKLPQLDFKLRAVFDAKLPHGQKRLTVDITTGLKRAIRVDLNASIVITRSVAVAKAPIPQGTKITESMVQSVERPINHNDSLLSLNEVIGKVTRRRIPQHTSIAAQDLSSPQEFVIRPNSLVDVVVLVGNTEVRMKDAMVLSSGRIGERIRLRNMKSKAEFAATLVTQNLAQINR